MEVRATLAILFALFVAVPAQAEKLVRGELKYTVPVKGPSHLVTCGNSLWIFSAGDESLISVSLQSGREEARAAPFAKHAGERVALTALGCSDHDPVFALERKDAKGAKSSELYRLAMQDPLSNASWTPFPVKLPGSGTVQDVTCGKNACYLLQGKDLFRGERLASWQKIAVPAVDTIPSVNPTADETPGDNPFRHWQERFVLAQNAYMRALPHPVSEAPVLLDSGRSQVIELDSKAPVRFGNWGVWEGRLMRARGFAALPAHWAISDVGLKRVFLFSTAGQYTGALANGDDPLQFQYPLDVATRGAMVYVADFRANAVVAVALAQSGKGELKIKEVADDISRTNLFRNPLSIERYDEDRCLSCHDGTQVQSLFNFARGGTHHPVRPRTKENDTPVRCSTCHSPHHEQGKLKPIGSAICKECHAEKTVTGNNHIGLKAGANSHVKGIIKGRAFEVSNCIQCHTMHEGEEHLLRAESGAICFNCHAKAQAPVNHLFGDVKPKAINCLSCHQLHGGSREESFAKAARGNATCLSCHRELKPEPGVESHLTRVRAKMKKERPWRAEEQVCVECHNPHEKLPTRGDLCVSCHAERRQVHTQIITVAETSRAAGIRLKNEQITCLTCHSAHGKQPTEPALLNFCASCHAKDAEVLRKDFHKRFAQGSRSKK